MGKGGHDQGGKPGSDQPGSASTFPAWARTVEECQAEFKVTADHGLRSDEVPSRRSLYGSNELQKHSGPSIWQLVLEQFNDTLVRILLVAAVVSFVLAWYSYSSQFSLPLILLKQFKSIGQWPFTFHYKVTYL